MPRIDQAMYAINIQNIKSDTELALAFASIEKGGVILLEDIDSFKQAHDRTAAEQTTISLNNHTGATLSGLLNVLDGASSRENRILVITTNHIDRLDEAIVRPGRVDVCEHLGLVDDVGDFLSWRQID